MKIFELDNAVAVGNAVNAAAGTAMAVSAFRRGVKESVNAYVTLKGAEAIKTKIAGGAVPILGMFLGAVFAFQHWREKPQDYIGIGLWMLGSVLNWKGGVAVLLVQLARDNYHDSVKNGQAEMKKVLAQGGSTTKPEFLSLTGNYEKDLIRYPSQVKEITGWLIEDFKELWKDTEDAATRREIQDLRNREAQARADAISPEAGQAQAARAAAAARLGARYQPKED